MDNPVYPVEPLLGRRPIAPKQKKKLYLSRGLVCLILNLLFLSAVFLVIYLKDHEKRSHQVVDINIQFSDATTTEDPSIVTLLNGDEDPGNSKILSRQYRHLKTLPSDNSTFSSQESINTSDNSTSSQHRIVACYDLTEEKEPTDEQLSMLTHIIFYPMEIYSNGTITVREDTKEKFERLVKKAKQFNVKVMISTVLLSDEDIIQNDTDLYNAKVKKMFAAIMGEAEETHDLSGMPGIMMDEDRRRTFRNSIIEVVQLYKLDGVDVRWRWSRSSDHETKLILLCKELRAKLSDISFSANRTDPFTITVATGLTIQESRINEVSELVDFFNIEADYVYRDFGEARGPALTFSFERDTVEKTLKHYSCLTKSPKKLNLVIRFHHRISFGCQKIHIADCDKMIEQVYRRVKRRRSSSSFNKTSEFPRGFGRGLYPKTGFAAQPSECRTARNLKEKLDYLKDKNIGGVTIWRIGNDDREQNLLKMVKAAKLSYQEGNDNFLYDCN